MSGAPPASGSVFNGQDWAVVALFVVVMLVIVLYAMWLYHFLLFRGEGLPVPFETD